MFGRILLILVAMLMVGSVQAQDRGFPECYARADAVRAYGRENVTYPPDLTGALRVSGSTMLKSALAGARDGDVIVVADGRYDIGPVKVQARISLFGETLWGATLEGGSILEILAPGTRIEGLRFEGGGAVSATNSRDRSIHIRAAGVRVANNWFHRVGVASTVKDGGGMTILIEKVDGAVIENNRFTRNHGVGVKSTDHARNIVIARNDFLDSPSYGPSGIGEIVQIGNAWSTGQATSPHDDALYATIRRNFVCGWTLEGELVSIKGDVNLIEDNLIEKSGGAVFVIRMGNRNILRRNVMRDVTSPPLRISGESNLIEGNCFETSASMASFHAEVGYAEPKKDLARAYWSANDNTFRNNTYIGVTAPLKIIASGNVAESWGKAVGLQYSFPSGNTFTDTVIHTADPNAFLKSFADLDPRVVRFENAMVYRYQPSGVACSTGGAN